MNVREILKTLIPAWIMPTAGRLARMKALKQLRNQGTGLRPRDEAFDHGGADLTALDALLSEDGLLFGDRPTTYDATLYAFVTNSFHQPGENPLKYHVHTHPKLLNSSSASSPPGPPPPDLFHRVGLKIA